MRKPTRLERKVETIPVIEAGFGGVRTYRTDILKLVKAEHRAIRRKIWQRIAEVERGSQCQENVSYRLALVDLLAMLEAMGK